jgi:hypothetical protein
MSLPKIVHPIFDVTVPSSKKNIKIRVMLQKEEKLLLIAKEGDDPSAILDAIRQVVNNCIVTEKFDVDELTIFDLEYIFIKLRAVSVSNTTKVSYKDNADEEVRDFDIDLNKVTIEFPKNIESKVVIDEATYLTLKYPSAKMYSDREFLNSAGQEAVQRMVGSVIDKVYSGTAITDAQTSTPEELNEFISNLPVKSYESIREYVFNLPHLNYEIKYKNNKGDEKKITLSTLNDFFTLA